MIDVNNDPEKTAELRKRAEEIAKKKAARSPGVKLPFRRGFSGKWRVTLVLLASLLISFSGWYLARGITIRRAHDRFDFRVKTMESTIRERLQAYEFLLRSGAGLFAASDEVTREEWKTYVATMQVNQSYPGIQGVGFSIRILPSEKETHIRRFAAKGFPNTTYGRRESGRNTPRLSSWSPSIGEIRGLLAMICFRKRFGKKPCRGLGTPDRPP